MAIDQARDLDAYFEQNKRLLGPLHGLPVTLKDQFHVKGLDTSMGYIGWLDTFEGHKGTGKEYIYESLLVRELKSLGAVPIGKMSLVMSLWTPETKNNLLGYLWNPQNQKLSAGGSSGGEGALQALRGSSFGIGTDIGGSVSMPASFNGIFSIKPSFGRIPFKGVANSGAGQQVMPTVIGIIGHSVEILRLVSKSILSTRPWLQDPYALPLPWNEDKTNRVLRSTRLSLGYMEHDGIVTAHPPITRAVRMVKTALENQGHETIEWKQPDDDEALAIHLSGEPAGPEISHIFPGGELRPPPITLLEYEHFCTRLKAYRETYLEYWNSTASQTQSGMPVDAVILPVTPYAGIRPGGHYYAAYNCFINVLDYTSVVIPVTKADKHLDTVSPDFEPLTERDEVNMSLYDPDIWDGAPASIQIMGKKLEEEKLLAIAQVVVDALDTYRQQESGYE